MLFSQRVVGSVLVVVLVIVGPGAAFGLTPEEGANLIASRLEQDQIKDGTNAGVWQQSVQFLGPITAAMVSAYEWLGDPAYRVSADLAGAWILDTAVAQGNLFGDEAYAFMRLSEIDDDPNHNIWRNALVDFFLSPRKHRNEDSTDEYLRFFDDLEPSTAVFYLGHYLVASDYVQDEDTDLYRQAVIHHLYRVDDTAGFPMMALGVATWALILTNTPADTPILAYGVVPNPYWDGVTVGDLPDLLAGHQVPEGEPFAGSFYWRFDHTDGGTGGVTAGYTEDAVFGTQGLVAAAWKSAGDGAVVEEADQAIEAAREALLLGIDEEGHVYEHLACQGLMYDVFAGEMLEALWRVEQYLSRDTAVETEAEVTVESESERSVE